METTLTVSNKYNKRRIPPRRKKTVFCILYQFIALTGSDHTLVLAAM